VPPFWVFQSLEKTVGGFPTLGIYDARNVKFKFLEFGLVPEGRAGIMSAFEMNERETILLDAQLDSVIEPHAFRAVLGNGHGFTAFIAVRDREKRCPTVNECVKVEMSPCNMSTGRILL